MLLLDIQSHKLNIVVFWTFGWTEITHLVDHLGLWGNCDG